MASSNSKIIRKTSNIINEKNLPLKFNYKKNKVAIVKLEDYQSENVKNALIKIIELLGIEDYFNNKSILLKPNFLASTQNAFTPIEIIKELIKILKNKTKPKSISVGDSSLTKKFTSMTFKRIKLGELCEQEGINLVNFFESERVKVKLDKPTYEIEEAIYLPKEIIDTDLILNLPKLKTHTGYVYTGAIKNFFGLLGNKMKMHRTHLSKTDFQKMLADIYFAVEETNKSDIPKVLTIMDAVVAMEGKGPRAGKPRKVGVLIAGFNSAAVDILGYTLMNGNPGDLEAICSVGMRTGLPIDITKLEIVGEENYEKFIIKNFKKPNISLLKQEGRTKGGFFSKIIDKMTSISIKIKRNRCLLCEECVRHCPAEALFRKKERILINRSKCIECFCCGESCPNDAINTKWYLFRILPLLILIFVIGSIIVIFFLIQILATLF